MTPLIELDELTPRNLTALSAIDRYCDSCGSGPTLRKLAELMGLAAQTSARFHLLRLEELRLVRFGRTRAKRRIAAHTVQVTEAGKRQLARCSQSRNELAREPRGVPEDLRSVL